MSAAVNDTLIERAREFYATRLKAQLEPLHNGKLIGIDPDAGLYAVGDDPVAIYDDSKAQGSTGPQAVLRIGYDWTYQMLGRRA